MSELDAAMRTVQVSEDDFDLTAEVASLRAGDLLTGAVVTFVGTVREWVDPSPTHSADKPVMFLEHYPGMTARSIAQSVLEASVRFDVRAVKVIHRIGFLAPGDQIVMVAVASSHRHEAFACCAFLMEELKTRAPFWKKECTGQQGQWVQPSPNKVATG